MAVTNTDVKYRLSGGAGNTSPAAATGGAMSTAAGGIVGTGAQAVFQDAPATELVSGSVRYRCLYVVNEAANGTLSAATLWIASATGSASTELDVALDPAPVGSDSTRTIASDATPPAGVTFTRPASKSAGLPIGDVPAGGRKALWVRRTISPGATPLAVDAGSIRVEGNPVAGSAAFTGGTTAIMADLAADAYGVVTHTYYPEYSAGYATWKAMLTGLGVRHVRENLVNDAIQNTRLADLAASGLKASLIVDPRFGGFTTAAAAVAHAKSAFPAAIEQFEGPNEQENGATPDRAWQLALYNAVRGDATLTGVPVLSPSPAQPWGFVGTGIPAGRTAWGDLTDRCDEGNLHSYPGGQTPSANLATWVAEARKSVGPTKPLQATETGYHNATNTTDGHRPASQRAAGIYGPRLPLEYLRQGIRRAYFYQLLDQDTSTTSIETRFGLLNADYTAKPMYTAIRNTVALLADPGGSFTPGTLNYTLAGPADMRSLLLQKRDGTRWLCLWREVSVYDQTTGATPDAQNANDVMPAASTVTVTLAGAVPSMDLYAPNVSGTPQQSAVNASVFTVPLAGELQVLKVSPS